MMTQNGSGISKGEGGRRRRGGGGWVENNFQVVFGGKRCLDWTFFSPPLEFLEYVWAVSAWATSSAASSHSVVN